MAKYNLTVLFYFVFVWSRRQDLLGSACTKRQWHIRARRLHIRLAVRQGEDRARDGRQSDRQRMRRGEQDEQSASRASSRLHQDAQGEHDRDAAHRQSRHGTSECEMASSLKRIYIFTTTTKNTIKQGHKCEPSLRQVCHPVCK